MDSSRPTFVDILWISPDFCVSESCIWVPEYEERDLQIQNQRENIWPYYFDSLDIDCNQILVWERLIAILCNREALGIAASVDTASGVWDG